MRTLSLLLLGACGSEPVQGPPTETFPSFYGEAPQNLLIISIDTFRRDHMGRYGDERNLTPFLDALFKQGVALDNHRSCSNWTFPSSQCAMDGQEAIDIGAVPNFGRNQLPDRVTLASTLRDAGYFTALITSNGWLFDAEDELNTEYGFDHAEHPRSRKAENIYATGREVLYENLDPSSAPWFLHLHVKEPHSPYNPPNRYLDGIEDLPEVDYDLSNQDSHYDANDIWNSFPEEDRDAILQHLMLRYRGEIRYIDDQLRGIWVDLSARGLLDNTLVVVWTDHGEQFYEHGDHPHARDLYGEENDALGFFWAKNIIPDTVALPTTHQDLAPTALEALGFDVPAEMTGVPVSQLEEGRALHSYSWNSRGLKQSLVMDDLKLIYDWRGDKGLFDLVADPAEQDNIYDPEDPRVIAMWDILLPKTERLEELVTITPGDPGP